MNAPGSLHPTSTVSRSRLVNSLGLRRREKKLLMTERYLFKKKRSSLQIGQKFVGICGVWCFNQRMSDETETLRSWNASSL